MIDSHTHLTTPSLLNKADELLKSFKEIGGQGILNVAYDFDSIFPVLEYTESYSARHGITIKNAIGIHPETFNPKNEVSFEKTRKLLKEYERVVKNNLNKVSAIGETGLDYYHIFKDQNLTNEERETSIEMQKFSFRKQLEIAKEYNLPLTIHARELPKSTQCIKDILDLIIEVGQGQIKAVLHSYTGDKSYLELALGLGLYIGFNGIITYPQAENVREILRNTPSDRILLETDAPYLPPEQVRKDHPRGTVLGQPSDLRFICDSAAEIKGLTSIEMEERTDQNFLQLFS